MSGHSKWAKLKHFKGALDAKKSAMFSKVSHMITIAAREGGGDPETNFKLRLAIEKAKQVNMPKENIERAINRGSGKTGEAQIEEVIFEAFLPGGAALVIESLTDNKNRTAASLRRIFNKHGGSLVGQNAVLWMFERKGIIRISDFKTKILNPDDFQLKIIDSGAQDIREEGGELAIYTNSEDLQKIKEIIEKGGVSVDYAEVEWFPKNLVKISSEDQKKVEAIFVELDDDPDVSDYYSNII
ncbi:MAG: YebC/PmpR family DNA-binding transcriptional regulator [Patescibacteria group bacterium]